MSRPIRDNEIVGLIQARFGIENPRQVLVNAVRQETYAKIVKDFAVQKANTTKTSNPKKHAKNKKRIKEAECRYLLARMNTILLMPNKCDTFKMIVKEFMCFFAGLKILRMLADSDDKARKIFEKKFEEMEKKGLFDDREMSDIQDDIRVFLGVQTMDFGQSLNLFDDDDASPNRSPQFFKKLEKRDIQLSDEEDAQNHGPDFVGR